MLPSALPLKASPAQRLWVAEGSLLWTVVAEGSLLLLPLLCSCPPVPAAGMLALLQESGDSQTVVAAGEQWLSMHRHSVGARDVALSTAVAHFTSATAYLERRGDVVSGECRGLLLQWLLPARLHQAAAPQQHGSWECRLPVSIG